MKAIEIKFRGIKCDNPACDFKEETVKFKDYKTWLNKPCPKCGCILLTEADLKAIVRLINFINYILKPFLKFRNPRRKILIAQMNGSGQIKFKTKDS